MTTEQLIEAILFAEPEPLAIKNLARLVKKTERETRVALNNLDQELGNRGIVLIRTDEEVSLGTHPGASDILTEIKKEEKQKELGRAGLETISAVIYAGPLTKGRIDYLRGVNSGFILRHLMIRGLVERTPNPTDTRGFLYKPALELLSYLGISRVEELPNYEEIRKDIDNRTEEETKDDYVN